MAEVLNPVLHRRLTRMFGSVKVSNRGERMIARVVNDIDEETGQKRLLIMHAGEYYQVNCPYCNDTRHRLYVNHMYGQEDESGRRMLFLAICYNEECMKRDKNREDFIEKMDAINSLHVAPVKEGRTVPEEAREVLPPGECSLLSALPDSHKARVYIRSRGFDPDLLSDKFGVSYCHDSPRFTIMNNRLVFSIWERGKLKGWQGRYLGELPWKTQKGLPPKYFTCPESDFRSRCLFNYDGMSQWETGIIVEGPTDVFAMGSMSGCIFGNTMTEYQRRKFLSAFRDRTGVLLLDPEEYHKKATINLIDDMESRMPGRFCAVKLPDGTDPGSLGRDFLRTFVKEEAAKQGVKVRYRKVA